MNVENVNKAITIMTRHRDARHILNMCHWQSSLDVIEEEVHLCGTPCCFGGYIAVSPEFREDGGGVDGHGAPMFEGHSGQVAIRRWLDIPMRSASALCATSWAYLDEHGGVADNKAYPHRYNWAEVTYDDVLNALISLRDTGLLPGEVVDDTPTSA